MKLLHELKVIFPNLPDELVRQSIKKHGLDKTACSGALRILESQQISINHNYAPARFYPPEDNRTRTSTATTTTTNKLSANQQGKISSTQQSQHQPIPTRLR